MSTAIIIGTITFKDIKKNGFILTIRDHEGANHRVAVWGKTAQSVDHLCQARQIVRAQCLITRSKWKDKWYTNFTAEEIRPIQSLTQCNAIFEGFLADFKPVGSGYTLTIGKKAPSNLGRPTYHRVAIWGPKAKAISTHLRLGQEFHLECGISYTKRDGNTYTNFTAEKWGCITRPKKQTSEQRAPRDEDYFVPEPQDRDSKERRLAECFPA